MLEKPTSVKTKKVHSGGFLLTNVSILTTTRIVKLCASNAISWIFVRIKGIAL